MPSFSKLEALPRSAKTAILVANDSLMAAAAVWVAVLLRAGGVPVLPGLYVAIVTVLVMLLVPAVALVFGYYRLVLRFGTPTLVARSALVSGISGVILGAVGWYGGTTLMRALGLAAVFALVLFSAFVLSRACAHYLLTRNGDVRQGVVVAIYGAGAAGQQLVAMLRRTAEYHPAFFLDDAPGIHGRMVEGLPVLALGDAKLVERLQSKGVRQIYLAIPSLKATRRREILESLGALPFHVRSVPALPELMEGGAKLDQLTEISIEDLLGRDPVPPLPGLLEKCIRGKGVLITGGGGSIGSELCRQVLALRPRELVVLERSEFALYLIEQELLPLGAALGGVTELRFQLGSVTDAPRLQRIFAEFDIDTVYHAAAYKHVPIVERNPAEGLRNNALGTWKLARAAAAAGVGHFVLISTDKAVRPTNVMGATKRVAELVVQALADEYPESVFSMVRFGNVLDSSGSVVPLFRKQIESGGPITLTHPEVTRFFMTIPEAVQLVIQAGAMARGGEVFVLDMGVPVKILDLAVNMVRLSGLKVRDSANPQGDIAIEVTGLRPGEKLYEELMIGGDVSGTEHPRILRAQEGKADWKRLEHELESLDRTMREGGAAQVDVPEVLGRWVAGYRQQEAWPAGRAAPVIELGAARPTA
ncbi:MAG: polysaccharide biosynthesis protein [Burkholderiales bacterium]|nr:polysaccharide biosynthesis protein [Burkholderiales bacterium]